MPPICPAAQISWVYPPPTLHLVYQLVYHCPSHSCLGIFVSRGDFQHADYFQREPRPPWTCTAPDSQNLVEFEGRKAVQKQEQEAQRCLRIHNKTVFA